MNCENCVWNGLCPFDDEREFCADELSIDDYEARLTEKYRREYRADFWDLADELELEGGDHYEPMADL